MAADGTSPSVVGSQQQAVPSRRRCFSPPQGISSRGPIVLFFHLTRQTWRNFLKTVPRGDTDTGVRREAMFWLLFSAVAFR